MLYTFDNRDKWLGVSSAFRHKYPGGHVYRLERANFDAVRLEELALGGGLFGDKILAMLDEVEVPEDLVARLTESKNTFAWWRPAKAKAAKFAGGGNFALAEAVGARDKKQAWLLYQEALAGGEAAEELFWKIVWQVKMMLLVSRSGDRNLKTVKPFVAAKSRRLAANFAPAELVALSGALIDLWHRTTSGQAELPLALEHLILSL